MLIRGLAALLTVQSTILQLEEQWRVAQYTNDAAAYSRLLAPDLTFIGTSGSLRDRADYIASRWPVVSSRPVTIATVPNMPMAARRHPAHGHRAPDLTAR